MDSLIIDLPEPYKDDRGSIQMLVEFPVASALVISSKAGAVRANHYHKKDEHYAYVASGRVEYHYRPAESTAPAEVITIEQGQMFHTPSRFVHAMKFLADSVIYVFSTQRRDQESYEADVVRVQLLDPADYLFR